MVGSHLLMLVSWIKCISLSNFLRNVTVWCDLHNGMTSYQASKSKYSLPVKFASQLSLQTIFKKSGFNFLTNLLVFAVSQTWQHNLS